MGCWGITAFESDSGLDAVGFIRINLPEDGKLELGKIIEAMRTVDGAEWYVPDAANGESHTGPMALAEIMAMFLNGDTCDLDYDEEWAADDNKFSSVTSFTADKESVQWLRGYISDTLKYSLENAEYRAQHGTRECDKRGGWREEKDWHGWQDHMSTLVSRMDTLLALPESQIELIRPQEQANGPVMGQLQ